MKTAAETREFIELLRTYPPDSSRYAETLWMRCQESAQALDEVAAALEQDTSEPMECPMTDMNTKIPGYWLPHDTYRALALQLAAARQEIQKICQQQAEADIETEAELATLRRNALVLNELAQKNIWQPIETAPKDGRAILLLSPAYEDDCGPKHEIIQHDAKCAIGSWNPDGTSWVDERGQLGLDCYTLAVTGTWSSGGGWFQPNEVTHWMPLPEPPDSQREET